MTRESRARLAELTDSDPTGDEFLSFLSDLDRVAAEHGAATGEVRIAASFLCRSGWAVSEIETTIGVIAEYAGRWIEPVPTVASWIAELEQLFDLDRDELDVRGALEAIGRMQAKYGTRPELCVKTLRHFGNVLDVSEQVRK